LKNTATAAGHAVYVNSTPAKKRDSTAEAGDTLDSTKAGPQGGWDE
jgi:hypothetical protein